MALSLCLLTQPAWAQEKSLVQKFDIYPAAAPVPALKYGLLPEQRDLTPGNAAQLYYRAGSSEWWGTVTRDKFMDKVYAATETPLKDMPKKELWLLDGPQLKEVDRAARRSYCDWEFTPRLREEGFAMLVPEFQNFRTYAAMLAVRSRLELAEGKRDKASRSYQTGLALSRHVGDGPTLIQHLVGVACARVMMQQVETWVQQPDSPNLYWSLTDLPRPFLDLRKPIEGERLALENIFGEIRASAAGPKIEPIAEAGFRQRHNIREPFLLNEWLDAPRRDDVAGLVVMAAIYRDSKRFLLDQGRTAAEVDALPVFQVVLLQQMAIYDRTFDDMMKWRNLPFPIARAGLKKAEQKMREERAAHPAKMFLASAVPAVHKVYAAVPRLEQRIDALRIVEALRIHAAATGELPATLDAVTEVPIPLDPISGKAFQYKRDDSRMRATLYGPPPEGEPEYQWNLIRFEITLNKAK